MKQKILRFNDGLYLACILVAGMAILVMSLIIPWGIFTRYVLGSGSQWPEPIAILLMVLFTFLGAAASYRAGAHIAVAMLTSRLATGLREPLNQFTHILVGVVSVFMVFYGARLCIATMHQGIGEIPWMPVGVTYLPVPVGGLVTLIFVIEYLFLGRQDERHVVRFEHEVGGEDA